MDIDRDQALVGEDDGVADAFEREVHLFPVREEGPELACEALGIDRTKLDVRSVLEINHVTTLGRAGRTTMQVLPLPRGTGAA